MKLNDVSVRVDDVARAAADPHHDVQPSRLAAVLVRDRVGHGTGVVLRPGVVPRAGSSARVIRRMDLPVDDAAVPDDAPMGDPCAASRGARQSKQGETLAQTCERHHVISPLIWRKASTSPRPLSQKM